MMHANEKMFEFMSNYLTEADLSAAKAIAKVSAYIHDYRMENGYSQKEFAAFMGVTQSMVSKWESGEYNFTLEAVAKIAEKLDAHFEIEFSDKDAYLQKSSENLYQMTQRKRTVVCGTSMAA